MAKFLDLDGLAKYTEALRANMVESVNGRKGKVTISKTDVSLGNVTNDSQVKRSEMAKAGGVATLDASGKVPAAQLPSYVDDVLMFVSRHAFPATGEEGKIYVSETDNKTYRWAAAKTMGEVTTSAGYVEISASLALGENSSTAFPGDRGKALETTAQSLIEFKAETEPKIWGPDGLSVNVDALKKDTANIHSSISDIYNDINRFADFLIEDLPGINTTISNHTESINGLLAWTTSMVAITDTEIDNLFN